MRWMCLLSLAACADKNEDSAAVSCESGEGQIWGRVWNANVEGEPVPMQGAAVYLFAGDVAGGTPELELRSEADGAFSVALAPGTWTLTGEELGTGCFTGEALTVSLAACEAEEVELTMDVWGG